jgi:hypothetical protein
MIHLRIGVGIKSWGEAELTRLFILLIKPMAPIVQQKLAFFPSFFSFRVSGSSGFCGGGEGEVV